jgi:hypothetical protein
MTHRWAGLNILETGIGVSLYEEGEDEDDVVVVDETWLTDAEIEEVRADPDNPGRISLDD